MRYFSNPIIITRHTFLLGRGTCFSDLIVPHAPLPHSRRKVEVGVSQSYHRVPQENGPDFMALYCQKWPLSERGSYIRNYPANTRINHLPYLIFRFAPRKLSLSVRYEKGRAKQIWKAGDKFRNKTATESYRQCIMQIFIRTPEASAWMNECVILIICFVGPWN